jgi:hypothetical protein
MMDSIRHQWLGKVHQPQAHMQDFAGDSISVVSHTDYQTSLLGSVSESEVLARMVRVMERLVRVTDQLDETLTKNNHFYFLTSKRTVVPYTDSVYLIVCLLVGYFVPILVGLITRKSTPSDWQSHKKAIVFFILTYGLGLFFLKIPSLYLEYHKVTNIKHDLCLGP